jgi:hypothetical protein
MAHDSHGHGPVDDPNFVNDKPYETRDFFAFHSVLKWIFCLFVFIGITSAITFGIYKIMVPRSAERSSAFPLPQVRAVPPDPRLQANPMLDIRTFREKEATALTTYGVDPTTHDVHIPVDKAIDIVAQEGLPTRANPGEPNPNEPNEPSHTEGAAPAGAANTAPATGTTDTAPTSGPRIDVGGGIRQTPNATGTEQAPQTPPDDKQTPPDVNSTSGGQPAQPSGGTGQ